MNNDHVRRLLLKKDDKLTVNEAIEIVRIEEATRKQAQDMNGSTSSVTPAKEVNAMRVRPSASSGKSKRSQNASKKSRCENCGLFHAADKCQ